MDYRVIHLFFYILLLASTLFAAIITVPSREIVPPTLNSNSKENRTLGSADPNGTNLIFLESDFQNPCGNSMVVVKSDEDPNTGICKCKYGAMTSICTAKPVAFWKPTNSCYPLYEQGPCNAEEWLVYGEDDMPRCEKADCKVKITAANETPSPSFSFLYNNTCYETMSQSFCDAEEIVVFLSNLNKPTCVPQSSKLAHCYPGSIATYALSTQVALPCEGGYRRAPDGTCSHGAHF